MKPIIGINADVVDGPPQEAQVQANYYNAILKTGGIPVIIPPVPDDDLKEILGKLNGLMLIGGPDYDPAHYKEDRHDKTKVASRARDEFDMLLIQRAVHATNLPVLGICAGAQALNIGLGGSLIQDIPSHLPDSKVKHSSPRGWEEGFNSHRVKLNSDSKLAKIYGKEYVDCPTSHHQAVKRLGAGLTAVAYADDEIIEAVEFKDKPFVIGVQWHPERDFETHRKLFEAFVQHATKNTPSLAVR